TFRGKRPREHVILPCAKLNPLNQSEAQQTIRDERKNEKKTQKSGAQTSNFFFHDLGGNSFFGKHCHFVQTFYILGFAELSSYQPFSAKLFSFLLTSSFDRVRIAYISLRNAAAN